MVSTPTLTSSFHGWKDWTDLCVLAQLFDVQHLSGIHSGRFFSPDTLNWSGRPLPALDGAKRRISLWSHWRQLIHLQVQISTIASGMLLSANPTACEWP